MEQRAEGIEPRAESRAKCMAQSVNRRKDILVKLGFGTPNPRNSTFMLRKKTTKAT
jgi:hypothetical protein